MMFMLVIQHVQEAAHVIFCSLLVFLLSEIYNKSIYSYVCLFSCTHWCMCEQICLMVCLTCLFVCFYFCHVLYYAVS